MNRKNRPAACDDVTKGTSAAMHGRVKKNLDGIARICLDGPKLLLDLCDHHPGNGKQIEFPRKVSMNEI